MKSPITHRQGVPFFYDKSEVEFQEDVYERYHNMIVKHSALHLADELWGKYPSQSVLDFAADYYKYQTLQHVLEIGCGVGRWIASIAQVHPKAVCWGMDYSYQMLKRAHEFWVLGNDIFVDLSSKGFGNTVNLEGFQLSNLNFGLAKAADLPFSDNSQDMVLSSFLIDRLDDPMKCMIEMNRVLKPNGTVVIVTPLNFHKTNHWNDLYPPIKIHQFLTKIGFSILDWKEEMIIKEPLDARGNAVIWNCVAIAARKTA